MVQTGSYLFQQAPYLLGALLLFVGLVLLYARQSQDAGALAAVVWLGFRLFAGGGAAEARPSTRVRWPSEDPSSTHSGE